MSFDYTVTPPTVVNYNAADAPTGAAPAHPNPAALSVTAPTASNPTALSVTAPAHPNPAALSGAAPGTSAVAGLTSDPAVPLSPDGLPASLPAMPSAFTPAFINLSGGGPTLTTLNASAADAAAGRIVQGTVNGELKSYQVRVGTDAQVLPGIVHPLNYDAVTNAVVFVQL